MSIKDRVKAPTPPFFKKLRNAGLAILAISTTVLTAPVALPAILIKIAGYLAVAGTVTSTICQTVSGKDADTNANNGQPQ